MEDEQTIKEMGICASDHCIGAISYSEMKDEFAKLLHRVRQDEREKVIETILTHTEDENRDYCDADGLICRSECVRMAVKRLQNLT